MKRLRLINLTGLRRCLTVLMLSLLIVSGNQGLAMARGIGPSAGESVEMVLCTGTGPVTVWIDENGAPVAPPHNCPDCTLCLPHGLLPDDARLARVGHVPRPPLTRAAATLTSRPIPCAVARGPPVSL